MWSVIFGLLRLGVPLIAFVIVLQPLTDYIGNIRSERGSFGFYLGMTEVSVMWFVAALLVCSLVYVWLRRIRPVTESRPRRRPLAILVTAAVVIAVSSFLIWQVWPWNGEVFLNLRFGEWPQGVVLFALGVHAGERGWLDDLTPALIRRLAWWAVTAAAALAGLFGMVLALGDVDMVLQATEPGPAVLFAVVPLAAPLKFLVVAALAVPACYAAGYGLTQAPGTSKVF